MFRKTWNKIRPHIRGLYRVLNGLNGFVYDFFRYLRFSGWREDLSDQETRNYNTAMAYHGLEKSLSYKKRNPNSGWGNAERVFLRIKVAALQNKFGHHDRVSISVLSDFLNQPDNRTKPRAMEMIAFLKGLEKYDHNEKGTLNYSLEDFAKGKLDKPENFFLSRYSLREFAHQKVSDEEVDRALKLAIKTPSVCNRQAWHVYHSNESATIKEVLKYQNGNRPFGKFVQNLLVITTDLKAFFAGSEHYQHWIDGGLFSMSVMYAFHSLGIASCPLNWRQTPKRDKELRKAMNLKDNHTVIMMIAFGYPEIENKVCTSSRRPKEEIYTKIKLK